MPFINEERVLIVQTGDTQFQLAEPVRYYGRYQSFLVPAGQDTDLASVPIGLTWLIPRYGRWTKAAILHDYLWRSGVITKADADGIFRRALRELDVPLVKRWVMWSAVRLTSIVKHGGLSGTPKGDIVGLAAIWTAMTAFVAVPTIVVYLFTFLFGILEKIGDWFQSFRKEK